MAKGKKPAPKKPTPKATPKPPPKPGYAPQGSRAQQNNLVAQGVTDSLPAGTAYVMGSDNLGYGVAVAYDSTGNALGFVRANLAGGARVDYNPSGQAVNIAGPGSGPPTSGGGEGSGGNTKPKFSFDNIPEDPQYKLDRAAREQPLRTSLAGYEAGENTASYDYGIGFDRYASDVTDAQGRLIARAGDVNFSTLRMPSQSQYDADRGFDTANPFSRASLLNQSFTTDRKMSMGGYANRGLLTSGAYGRAQYRDADRYNRGASDLQKEFASRLGEYRAQRGQAYSNYDSSNIDDRRQLVERALRQFQLNNPSA